MNWTPTANFRKANNMTHPPEIGECCHKCLNIINDHTCSEPYKQLREALSVAGLSTGQYRGFSWYKCDCCGGIRGGDRWELYIYPVDGNLSPAVSNVLLFPTGQPIPKLKPRRIDCSCSQCVQMREEDPATAAKVMRMLREESEPA